MHEACYHFHVCCDCKNYEFIDFLKYVKKVFDV